jgi:hypothetical protein
LETENKEVKSGDLEGRDRMAIGEGMEGLICKRKTYQYPEVWLDRGMRRKLLLHKKMQIPASKHQQQARYPTILPSPNQLP